MKKYLKELDVYSGIAILFVVLHHAWCDYVGVGLNQGSLHLSCYRGFIESLATVCVAMFIFISGYKYQLNEKNLKYKEFAIKKMNRVIKPFIIISVFYILLTYIKYIYKTHLISYDIFLKMILDFLKIFIGYNIAYPLWYIPMYLFIVLSYPVIQKIIANTKIRMILFLFLFVGFQYLSLKCTFIKTYPYPFKFVTFYYLYEMGQIFYKYKNNNNKIVDYNTLGFVTSLLYIIIIICANSINTFDYIWINPIGVIFYYYISETLKNSKLLIYLGKYSFYIFLMHGPLFTEIITMNILLKAHILKYSLSVAIITIGGILGSILFYKLTKKLGLNKYIFN